MIQEVVIAVIIAKPTQVLGWHDRNLVEAWKLLVQMMEESVRRGFLPRLVTKLNQIFKPTLQFSIHSTVRQMIMGVLKLCLTLCPGKGRTKGRVSEDRMEFENGGGADAPF